jgi:hypothetical protein
MAGGMFSKWRGDIQPFLMTAIQSGGLRSGELFLRRQRMTLPMLETLRTETARVRITLEQLPESEDPELSVVTHDQFSIRPNRFCALKIQVTNLSCEHSHSRLLLC